ncbi:hypothetical protein QN277_017381 [Acacia crassicarpa]|uniref:VQ domain-containing protein n=1 Tax=Acacia crassicarpa TaxID=499986 RepID=A0AAE1KHU0_9FABA|nr:hypothetical protein QN277_017381 [Acacia crassicarpa]
MDSGNSGSISSSGDEEYDSRTDMLPPFLNPHPPFGSFPFLSHHHHQTLHPPPLFDLSPNYLQTLSSQTHPLNSNPSPFLNLDAAADSQDPPSEPNCTAPAVSSLAAKHSAMLSTDPSLQLRPLHDDNAPVSAPLPPANAVRNPKKRTRASRRAPTTVLTTDTSNFRAMVQEFTGIPAPPFSGTSYSRRLDLLTSSSSLRSSAAASSHLDDPTTTTTTPPFYPLRHLVLSSTSSLASPSSTLMLHNHVADAVASTTTGSNPSTSINYQTNAGAPYSHPPNMLTMQILPFQTPTLHPLNNPTLHVGFSAKSQPSTSIPSLEDQLGMGHAHLVGSHPHVSSSEAEGMPLSDGGDHDIGGHANKDQLRSFHVAAPCKLNFAGTSSSSAAFNPNKNLENTSTTRGEGNIDSWICSSD